MKMFMTTHTGRTVSPSVMTASDIVIEDIAHALANICRFGGHTDKFYSVAQHSVLVALSVPPEDALHALMHDAAEAYVGDVIMPLKVLPAMTEMLHIERRIRREVAKKFGLAETTPESVVQADVRMMATEGRDVMRNNLFLMQQAAPYDHFVIEPWAARDAKIEFLRTYDALMVQHPQVRAS